VEVAIGPEKLTRDALLYATSLRSDVIRWPGAVYRLRDRDPVPDPDLLRLRVLPRLAVDFAGRRRAELVVFLPFLAASSCFCSRSTSF